MKNIIMIISISFVALTAAAGINCTTPNGSIKIRGSTLSEGITGISINELTVENKSLKKGNDFVVSGSYADSSNLFIEILDGVGNKLLTVKAIMSLSAGPEKTPLAIGFINSKKGDQIIRCEFLQ